MIELIHPELSNVSKKDIKAKLASTMKTKDENISIFGLKTKFGGGRSTGFALVYDSLEARKKFDSKKMLRRVSSQNHFMDPQKHARPEGRGVYSLLRLKHGIKSSVSMDDVLI